MNRCFLSDVNVTYTVIQKTCHCRL